MLKRNEGFTLVELLVTIVVGTLITAAATTLLLTGMRINNRSNELAVQQNTTRMLMEAGVTEVAQVLVDSVYDMAGGAGEFAILSASSTATNQNAWIAAMETIIAGDAKYADLVWVETVYGDDESQKSTDEMQNLMTKWENLEVVCCPTTVGILAAAKVVENDPSCGIKVAGLGLPSEMANYLGNDKACPYMYLWNPIEVGETAVYMIKAIIDGKVGEIGTSFGADNGKTYEISAGDPAEKQIIVGPPFAFTGDNIADWKDVY